MSFSRAAAATALIASALGLSACGTVTNALGLKAPAPDEFRVVTKAPLVVPPEFALRPPAPGELPPTALRPQQEALAILAGRTAAVSSRSQGETLLVQKVTGDKPVDPMIRYTIDDENGNLSHKEQSFANLVMNWRPGQAAIAPATADNPNPIDPAAEDKRLQDLTGGKTVIISRQRNISLKIPGL
ncbi:MAG: hypothetical protein JWM33_1296 [Caulobacteraceae bacterium]|nr:hypothetical protein [Caulobacteraceae bacterium]